LSGKAGQNGGGNSGNRLGANTRRDDQAENNIADSDRQQQEAAVGQQLGAALKLGDTPKQIKDGEHGIF
jgi:hypothetical protein